MSMNILIAGATGKTGLHLVQELLDKGHKPTALVREGSDTSRLPDGVSLRTGDLTDLPSDVCDGMDAVVFAAGSGGSTGPEMTDKVDRDGAKAAGRYCQGRWCQPFRDAEFGGRRPGKTRRQARSLPQGQA